MHNQVELYMQSLSIQALTGSIHSVRLMAALAMLVFQPEALPEHDWISKCLRDIHPRVSLQQGDCGCRSA